MPGDGRVSTGDAMREVMDRVAGALLEARNETEVSLQLSAFRAVAAFSPTIVKQERWERLLRTFDEMAGETTLTESQRRARQQIILASEM